MSYKSFPINCDCEFVHLVQKRTYNVKRLLCKRRKKKLV